jgi:hypothetical protein
MGRTESSRDISLFTTPEELSVSKIWNLWLPKYISDDLFKALDNDKIAKFRIQLLFAVVAPIPRCVQYVVCEIENYFQTTRDSNMLHAIDSKALDGFYTKSYAIMAKKYAGIKNCTFLSKHARALLFEEEMNIDDYLTNMVRESFLVNSLDNICNETKLVPKTSIISMKIYLNNKRELHWLSIREAIEKLEELFTEEPNKVKLGKFLEAAVRGLINARLYVLMKVAIDAKSETIDVSISQLLLLSDSDCDDMKGASGILISMLLKDLSILATKRKLNKLPLHDSYLSMKNFLSDANISPEISGDIMELKPAADKESFDNGIMLTSGKDGKSIVVVIEIKSGRQLPYATTDISGNESVSFCENKKYNFDDLPKNGKQALHFLNIVNEAKKLDASTVKSGSLLEALREGNFVYIYVTTAENAPSFAVGDHVMQLGETHSKRLLSFLVDSYRLVRTASTAAQALDKPVRDEGI